MLVYLKETSQKEAQSSNNKLEPDLSDSSHLNKFEDTDHHDNNYLCFLHSTSLEPSPKPLQKPLLQKEQSSFAGLQI